MHGTRLAPLPQTAPRRRSQIPGLACVSCTVLAALTSTGLARAGDRAAAQALFDAGRKLLAEHDYARACPKFEESQRLDPALGTLLNLADCYEREGHLAAAWASFLEVASRARTAGQVERLQIARTRAQSLAARVAKLVLRVPFADQAPGIELKRDGQLVGAAQWGDEIPVDPGPHLITASAPGRAPWSRSVTLAEGALLALTVPELAPLREAVPARSAPGGAERSPGAPAAQPANRAGFGAQKTLALVSAGVGLVGVGIGSWFGLQAIAKHKEAARVCPTRCSNTEDQALWNDATRKGNISTLAFAAGGVGLAGAALLWFTAKGREQPEPNVALGVGPASVELKAVW